MLDVENNDFLENKRLVVVFAVTTLILCTSILNSDRVLAVQKIPDFSIAAVGDWGCTDNTSKTVANIVKSNPALVIGLADNSYEETGDCWLNMTKPLATKLHTSFGNHDASYGLVIQYLKYFNLGKTYYSFDFENIHFITIDTNIPFDINSDQFKFVKADLEQAASNKSISWIIPFFHFPAYTITSVLTIKDLDPIGSLAVSISSYDNLKNIYQPLFDKYGIDMILQGHAHNYQRTFPIAYNETSPSSPIIKNTNNNTFQNPTGEIFLTVGTGGHSLHQFVGDKPPYIAASQDTQYGFLNLKFTNNGTSVTGTFYSNDKTEPVDEFTVIK
jgi:3',5'-cyclic AMP phosphodiesterase CpdA